MIDPHDASLPEELRSTLHDQPPEKRRQMARLWSLLGEARDDQPVRPSLEDAWAGVRSATDGDLPAVRRAPDRASRRSRYRAGRGRVVVPIGVAAIAVLLGLLWIYRPVSVVTLPGEQRTVRLPDGSLVEMNSATVLEYAAGFRTRPYTESQRRVELRGEAFFEVTSSSAPFVIETPDGQIEVVGTSFNVRAREGRSDSGTVVTVAEGRVVLRARNAAARPLTLEGEGAVGRLDGSGPPEPISHDGGRLDQALAWRQRGFAVVDRPLDAVLDEVERRYAVEIAPREGIDLSDPMNLFYLRGAAPDTILRDICLYHDCVYRETSRGYALGARPSSGPPAASSLDGE